MAIITVSGDIKTGANPRRVTLWETYTVEQANGSVKENRRPFTVWFQDVHPLADGDWVELRGEFSSKISETKSQDGTSVINTWTRADGTVMQNIDLIINKPELLARQNNARTVDQDDAAKYGNTPF